MLIKKISHFECSYHLIPSVNNTAALQGLSSIFIFLGILDACSTLNDSEFQQAILKVTLCGCYMFAFLLTSPLISCCCCKTNSWVGSKKMETALPSDSCISEKVLPASCLHSRQCFQNKISTAFEKHRGTLSRNVSSRSVAHPGQFKTVMCS